MARERVPVIDMQKVEGLGKEIRKACEEWGCFRILNHGIPVELMVEMKAVCASIFDLPEEIKRRTADPRPGKGYDGRYAISPFYEGFSIDDISSTNDFCNCLDASTHQREIIQRYIKAIHDLAGHLGRKLMEGSGLDGDLFDGWWCQLRINKYHYCLESVGLVGARLHTDASFLTILQDDENVNGLQIVDKISGEFAPVNYVPGTLVIIVGDIGKIWSNGRYYNVNHRAMCFEPKTRYSIGFFVNGPTDKKIEAPSKLVDSSEHPRLYVPVDVDEYIHLRFSTEMRTGGAVDLFRTTTT
ncbi:putative gibberellin 3-beta-dioxygenase [Helianthus debilis subsp. tardiflorus]